MKTRKHSLRDQQLNARLEEAQNTLSRLSVGMKIYGLPPYYDDEYDRTYGQIGNIQELTICDIPDLELPYYRKNLNYYAIGVERPHEFLSDNELHIEEIRERYSQLRAANLYMVHGTWEEYWHAINHHSFHLRIFGGDQDRWFFTPTAAGEFRLKELVGEHESLLALAEDVRQEISKQREELQSLRTTDSQN
jgi:hypothetical protein